MEYYSAIKKNEILPFVTTWMDPEGIMLSEISQTEKDKYHISLTCGIFKKQNKTKKQAYRYKEQVGKCQKWGERVGKMGKGGQKVQTSSYKRNKSWDVMYSMVTIVNTVLHI